MEDKRQKSQVEERSNEIPLRRGQKYGFTSLMVLLIILSGESNPGPDMEIRKP